MTSIQELSADIERQADRFVGDLYTFSRRERVRLSGRLDVEIWQAYADMGWLMAGITEEDGGIGEDLAVGTTIARALGRALALEPWLGSAILAAQAICLAGDKHQRASWLPGLMSGESIAAFAYSEPGAHGFGDVAQTRAHKVAGGFRLIGRKTCVLGGPVSDLLVVSARTVGDPSDKSGIGLFVVPIKQAGVELKSTPLLDGRLASEVICDDVFVGHNYCLGGPEGGGHALDAVLAQGLIMQAADNVGTMESACVATHEHIRVRRQFGKSLSEFQVVAHRLAEMVTELECAKSLLFEIAARPRGYHSNEELSGMKASIAKAAHFVTANAIQLHGALGMTEECVVGHLLKRVTVNDALLGTTMVHRSRFAEWLSRESGARKSFLS